MKQAIFPDGVVVEGPTWAAVLDALGADPWNPSNIDKLKVELAARAHVWSEWYVNPKANAVQFMRAMEAAGMCRLEESE